MILSSPCRTFAAAPVDFGSASDFTILAGSGITSIGGGTVQGDVGLSPTTGAAITGLTAPQVYGVIYTVDAAGPAGSVEDDLRLIAAKDDLTTAYNTTAGYYLERWSDGLWQRVSADRIWPHLLVSGTRTYEQADPAAPLGTTQRYCIIELDNRGRLLSNGPYDLQLDGGEISYDAWATGIAWNGAAADSASDPDGDGLTNFQEYLAGTDPLVPNSILRVNRAEAVAEGLQLTWGSTTGRVYAVEMTPSLIKPFVAIASGIAAEPPENNYVVPIDPRAASGVFFRVVVSQP